MERDYIVLWNPWLSALRRWARWANLNSSLANRLTFLLGCSRVLLRSAPYNTSPSLYSLRLENLILDFIMPPRRERPISTQRRYFLYKGLRRAPFMMRPYNRYLSHGLEYRKSLSSNKCGEYIRISQPYSLVVTPREFASVNSQLTRVKADLRRAREAKLKAKAKTRRLKAQRQALLKRQDELTTRKLRNIKELEVNEALADLGPAPLSPTSFF